MLVKWDLGPVFYIIHTAIGIYFLYGDCMYNLIKIYYLLHFYSIICCGVTGAEVVSCRSEVTLKIAGLGICSLVFWANRWFFAHKKANERFAQKKRAISSFFGERTERFTHGGSFLVSDLSDSLTSLFFGERSERFAHIAHQKWGNERIAHFLKQKNLYITYYK